MQSLREGALSRVVEFACNCASDLIWEGEVGKSRDEINVRAAFFSILHNLPITCRGLFHDARQHPAFEYILFYERVRLGIASPYYFMDGVPAGVQLFVGPTSLNLPNADITKLKLRDVVADRLQIVAKMEQMGRDEPRKVHLTTTHLAGLSEHVPGPARFLVARTRAILRGLRATKRPEHFVQCANCNCNRLFYAGGSGESWASADVTQVIPGDPEETGSSDEYWQKVAEPASTTEIDSTPDTRRFCSQVCSQQHAHHLKIMMPDAGLYLDADDSARKTGRARVAESFKLALKRNEVAARSLRTMRTKSMPNLAISAEELEVHREVRIRALNVDLGLLYAASLVAESSSLSNGKILPGQRMYWRDDACYYSKPVSAISKIYSKTKRKEGIISSMLTVPRFLEMVQVRAHKYF
jgi:hypothetical protein